MNKYIVVLSIGPVQSMIAAARRSRDLWSGSWLLSELSKACAKQLKEDGATLIFPYVTDDKDLEINSEFSVGNKLQVLIEAQDTQNLKAIIEQAKKATQRRFVIEADAALKELNHAQSDIRTDIWETQKKGYLEIQAAWAWIDPTATDGYARAVQNAMGALAARKATRDFRPAATDPYDARYMLPKSSLDGAFETVLNKSQNKLNRLTRIKLSLSDSEQLDCLGVIKRRGFEDRAEQFTPFTRIAAHAWISDHLIMHENIEEIKNVYAELVKLGAATRVRGNIDIESNKSIYQDFTFDAQLLYPYRLDAALQLWRQIDEAVCEQLKLLKDQLKPIWQEHGEPYSYGVMLLADGDRMGELLDKANSQQQHQAITQALSKFAASVATTMRTYNGHCIYAGGDDVLGFVPLDKAYDCSKRLSDDFASELKQISEQLGQEQPPTLSVGLAICHIMTPMSVIRDLAKQSEKLAKGDHIVDISKRRNALNLLLSIRSGTDISVRYQWHDCKGLDALKNWVSLYNAKAISSRVAYSIRDIYLRTRQIASNDQTLHRNIQTAELKRMLIQARQAEGGEIDSQIIEQLTQRGVGEDESNQSGIGLDMLADELIVARWLAAKTQQELGKE